MRTIRKILYPTDFSEHSLSAFSYAREMAAKFAAQLHCLHVLDDTHFQWMTVNEAGLGVDMKEHDFYKLAQVQMDKFLKEHFDLSSDQPETHIIQGRPFLEIIKYARSNKIDLIVMATHGHGALSSMFLGSVAEKVVRKAPCAVLTVRHPDHKFETP